MWKTPAQVRFDVLSFDPPVKGMSRRMFVVEEHLFDPLQMRKGVPVYRVLLPGGVVPPALPEPAETVQALPLPSTPPPPTAAKALPSGTSSSANPNGPPAPPVRPPLFSRTSRAMDEDNWRRNAAPVTSSPAATPAKVDAGSALHKPATLPVCLTRATIWSPLTLKQDSDPSKSSPALSAHWGQTALALPMTTSSPNSRPDPSLRQLWSQNLDKGGKLAANSLQGIADEPTPLSFTMQEMKSDYGETPPATTASGASTSTTPTTRMSVADVHSAFRTVPALSPSSRPSPIPSRPPPSTMSSSSQLSLPPTPSRQLLPPPSPGKPAVGFRPFVPGQPFTPSGATPGTGLYGMGSPQMGARAPPSNGSPAPVTAQGGWIISPPPPQGQLPQQQQYLQPPHPTGPYPVPMVHYPPQQMMYGQPPQQPPMQQPPMQQTPMQQSHMLPKPGGPATHMQSPAPGTPSGAGRGQPPPPHGFSPAAAPPTLLQQMGAPPVLPPGYHYGPSPQQMQYMQQQQHHPHPHVQMQPPPQMQHPGQPMPGMYVGQPRPPMGQYPSAPQAGYPPVMHPPPGTFQRPSW